MAWWTSRTEVEEIAALGTPAHSSNACIFFFCKNHVIGSYWISHFIDHLLHKLGSCLVWWPPPSKICTTNTVFFPSENDRHFLSVVKLVPGVALTCFLFHITHSFPLPFPFPFWFFPSSVGIKLRALHILGKCSITERCHQPSYMVFSPLNGIWVGLKGKSTGVRDDLLKS